ncbi:hypothetical protein B0A52_03782 [Exophiala mesophila]|uniref:Xylanolytic transcriptional activator regulatory domain-containing protein n=1 Tax=Exophiala mesophila TaxID=212818 RepID=A0A438N7G4_EXOME|nr:hypothetical protein B0A52_03782 [Exophiala mesophila]
MLNLDFYRKPCKHAAVGQRQITEAQTSSFSQSECTQCRSNGGECIVNFDDERRKPNSRAYINSLNERIAALESALKDKEKEKEQTEDPNATSQVQSTRNPSHSPVLITNSFRHEIDPKLMEMSEHHEAVITDSDATDGYSPPSNLSSHENESMVSKLLSTRGHLSFDQLSGRLRYFGPIANCHVHSHLQQNEQMHRQALEQQRRTQRLINSISKDTHDYLMNLFWQYYNSVIHVIHQAAFEHGQEHGGPFYSGFLHVCILAMGYRYADKTRPDIMKISIGNKESTIHKEAKFMLDYEIEQPGGTTSIPALLLLGDLECGVGRDNVGWLYAGMANRLCFDIGLHLDRSNSGLSERDLEIGRMTLLACVIYDKYWALFLGRPTNIKTSDLETYNLSQQLERLGKCLPAGPEKSLETQIYESLIDLMEIAGKITEIMDQAARLDDRVNPNHHVFVRMANLNRELEIWYTRLPKNLQWTPQNVQSAPFSFFLLHQQYHVAMILLHRPFARYDEIQPVADGNMEDYEPQPNMHMSSMSRSICTQHAVRVARIFWQHRQRFDTRHIFVTGMQHAGTAAIALIAALASLKDSSSRDANMHYLECLAAALQDMSETFQPAELMSTVLQAVILELRASLPQPKQAKIIPARRESTANDEESERFMPSKRHQSFRNSPPRTMSQSFIPTPQVTAPAGISELEQQQQQTLIDTSTREASEVRLANATSMDGFVVVTPRAEPVNIEGAWPTLTTDTSALDYPMFTNSNRPQFQAMSTTPHRSAWMGAETPAVSPPAGGNPYMFQSNFGRSSNDRLQDDLAANTSLDFLTLLGTDRTDFSTLTGNHDDYALLPTPTPTPVASYTTKPLDGTKDRPFTSTSATSSTNRQQDGSAARTMAGLDDLWNQMKGTNNKTR